MLTLDRYSLTFRYQELILWRIWLAKVVSGIFGLPLKNVLSLNSFNCIQRKSLASDFAKYRRKVLHISFHLNGHTLGFQSQTQKLQISRAAYMSGPRMLKYLYMT